MNEIIIRNCIIDNIRESHKIGNVQYNSADIIVPRVDGKEDILTIKFKSMSNPYTNGQKIDLVGNVRTYNRKSGDKNAVDVYIFTYFDSPDSVEDITNQVTISGVVCKIDGLRRTQTGKWLCRFILANNLGDDNYKFDSYIPCVLYGESARSFSDYCKIGLPVNIVGELHSREYRKRLSDTDIEIRVAHELAIRTVEVDNNETNSR